MAGYFKKAESSGGWREEPHIPIPVSRGVCYEGLGLIYLQHETSTYRIVLLIPHSTQHIMKVWDLLIDNLEWLFRCQLLACFLMPLTSVSPSAI